MGYKEVNPKTDRVFEGVGLGLAWLTIRCVPSGLPLGPLLLTLYAFADYYFHRAWKRWTAILKFDLFDANLNRIARDIPMWFALGKGRTPRAGRGSKYFKLWFQANGANAPRRNRADRLLSPRVFERRMVRVLVVTKDVIPPYSAVSEILSWETGASEKKAPMKVS